MKRKNGFTLIELVVVIALIAILAVTLAPRLRDQIAKGRDSKAIAVLGSLRTAAEVYFADNGQVPRDATGVGINGLISELDNSAQALVNQAPTADHVPIGGGRTAGSPNDVLYGGEISFTWTPATGVVGTADGISLWFESTADGGTNGAYASDTKGTNWSSY